MTVGARCDTCGDFTAGTKREANIFGERGYDNKLDFRLSVSGEGGSLFFDFCSWPCVIAFGQAAVEQTTIEIVTTSDEKGGC